ncbi:MAG: hypothetical protein GEU83_18160 [Pseudonocardiaceae bacterium]|nr:hypothetical protein [Pseudonocardiaceae bacterium]
MGRFLTSYGRAGYEHEGYAAQVLDDGSLTSEHSNETAARMIGQVIAACDCGWVGTTRYPTREECDEAAEELALQEWEHNHVRPVLEQHQRAQTTRLQRLLRELADQLTTTGQSDPPLVDRLDRILRALDKATQLAHQLREQAEHQHPTQKG